MRFIENEILERIGFDFYCGIANNIVKARAEMGGGDQEEAGRAIGNIFF